MPMNAQRDTWLGLEEINIPGEPIDIEKEMEKTLKGYFSFEQWLFLNWLEVKKCN